MSHSNSKIVAISTVKHLSRNYASFQQPSVQEWYSLSTSGQTQNIPNGIPLTFMEMDIFLQNAGTSKDLRIALKVCVMLTLNTVVFKLILLSLKRKRHCNHTPNSSYFQRCRFTSWDVSRHFMHTIFPANGFVTPTHIVTAVTAVTPVTAHSRNQ